MDEGTKGRVTRALLVVGARFLASSAYACVHGPSTGYLVRETYAHVIACPS